MKKDLSSKSKIKPSYLIAKRRKPIKFFAIIATPGAAANPANIREIHTYCGRMKLFAMSL